MGYYTPESRLADRALAPMALQQLADYRKQPVSAREARMANTVWSDGDRFPSWGDQEAVRQELLAGDRAMAIEAAAHAAVEASLANLDA